MNLTNHFKHFTADFLLYNIKKKLDLIELLVQELL